MHRSLCYLEIFLLLLLNHLGRNFPSDASIDCSRKKSRIVRMIIHKKILPILFRYKLSLPISCPFHHERDALWWPDVQFDFFEGQWICPVCGASVSSEEIVMDHWDKYHLDSKDENSICVAKFCDIFRCEVILASMNSEKSKIVSNTIPNLYHSKDSLIPCDHQKMSQLQKKCKIIMQHCLADISSSASVKDFQDIQEEVNLAICSYLTCQKYLDASLQVVHPVPALFSIVTGAVLVAAFFLCYYLVNSISHPVLINPKSFCNGVPKPRQRIIRKNGDVYWAQRNNRFVSSQA